MEYMKTLANDFREVDGYITRLSYRYEYGNSEFMEMTEADRRDRSFLRMQIHQLYVDYGYKFLKQCASMRKEWEYVLQELDLVRRDLWVTPFQIKKTHKERKIKKNIKNPFLLHGVCVRK